MKVDDLRRLCPGERLPRRRQTTGATLTCPAEGERRPLWCVLAPFSEAQVNAKAIRTKLGMTQQAFAARFGFSVNTLRHWEQGKREPEGPTRAYLLVIERAPRVVEKALKIA